MDHASREYHLRELEMALAAGPGELTPSLPAGGGRVLDIGCGAGQTLMALPREGWQAVGIDIDPGSISLGRELLAKRGIHNIHLLAAPAEHLPFAPATFDYIISRVALPYTDIPQALAEMTRVLRPEGRAWLMLHPLGRFNWRGARSLVSAVYLGYAALNTLVFHFTGRVFRFPLKRSRVESYQTRAGMDRCLAAAGFRVERVYRDAKHFLMEVSPRGNA